MGYSSFDKGKQEAEVATPSPDLSYVPYTGNEFKFKHSYIDLLTKISISKNIYLQE